MSGAISKHLSSRQLLAIDKIGDCMLPGDGVLPRFSQTRCSSQIDRLLDFMPATDLADLKTLLRLLGFFPRFGVALLLRFLEWVSEGGVPVPLGGTLRLIRFGLRGLAMTLYYGDPQIHAQIGYSVQVHTADFKPYTGTPAGTSPSPRPTRDATI